VQVVAGDPFNSDPDNPDLMSEDVRQIVKSGRELIIASKKIPMVELPLGATEDRVCGTINIEMALKEGGHQCSFKWRNLQLICN
jgi:magnesium chelatase subunit I